MLEEEDRREAETEEAEVNEEDWDEALDLSALPPLPDD